MSEEIYLASVCRTVKGVHVPGCAGCASYGHSRCTCPSKRERDNALVRKVAELERRIVEMEKFVYPALHEQSPTRITRVEVVNE